LRGMGLDGATSLLSLISRIFAYITQFFIVVGFITLLKERKEKLLTMHIMFTSLNMTLLMMAIILPNFANQLNMTRLYHILLLFLAPLCISGGQTFFESCFQFIPKLRARKKLKSYSLGLILIILIPYFLFQTEFVYEIAGHDSWSIPLSRYRMGERIYVSYRLFDEQDVQGAKWLSKNIDVELTSIYIDHRSLWILTNYGMTYSYRLEEFSDTTNVMADGSVYLTRMNTIYGILTMRNSVWNITKISPTLSGMNKVYSNGGSEIHK